MSDAPVEPRSILPVFIDTLNLLLSIHAENRKHAPLTPAAIRLNDEGHVEIASYANGETQGTVAFGSAKYAAPDALRQGIQEHGCAALDSYILAFIFYELFLGSKLFREEFRAINRNVDSDWLSWHANTAERVRPLAEVIPQFPPTLSQLVAGMLEKDPESRNKDLASIAEILQNTIENTRVTSKQTSASTSGRKTYRKLPKDSKPWHSVNRAKRDILHPVRRLQPHRYLRQMWSTAGRLLRVLVTSFRQGLGYPLAKITVRNCRERIEFFLERAARMAGQPRFYGSLASVVFLALMAWLCGSTTAGFTGVNGSLPPLILTDTGEMALVSAGEIALGTTHGQQGELRRETVYVPRFYMDQYEVTNQRYWEFCRATGRDLPASPPRGHRFSERPEGPVVNVPWSDARAFAEWAGKWLPSELEWKAAVNRAGHPIGIHGFETTRSGVRILTWVDANFLDPLGEYSPVIRVDGSIPLPMSLTDLDGSEEIRFRCAANTNILKTHHFLGKAPVSRSGSLR